MLKEECNYYKWQPDKKIIMLTILATKAINTEMDIVIVRQLVKEHAINLKFNLTNQTKIITAASEIARNTYKYGGGGQFTISLIEEDGQQGLHLIFEDKGPGIESIEQALQDGFTTGRGMGLGLSGSKRLVDRFELKSEKGNGTSVTLIKWKM
jgi:serine/threonine-protein kinase RsbT